MNQEAANVSTLVVTTEQWADINWVLLDMDGTLLDLCFDDTFWMEGLPLAYANHKQVPIEQAKTVIGQISQEVFGKLEWYCMDYWSDRLGFDVRPVKSELYPPSL